MPMFNASPVRRAAAVSTDAPADPARRRTAGVRELRDGEREKDRRRDEQITELRSRRVDAERRRAVERSATSHVGEVALRCFVAMLCFAAVFWAGSALAGGVVRPVLQVEGAVTPGPLGWAEFCGRTPSACAPDGPARPGAVGTLTDADLDALRRFNRAINAAYAPALDADLFGVADHWTLPGAHTQFHADCEDYVLAKRAALLAAGWPPEAVLIGVVEGTYAPYHAVLILRTDRGELVLDNLTDEIVDWRDSGYAWVIRQSTNAPNAWVRLL